MIISVIQDNGNFHFSRKLFPGNNAENNQGGVFLTEQVSVPETSYCNRKTFRERNKFLSQKNVLRHRNKICETKVSVREQMSLKHKFSLLETSFCPSIHQRNTFLSQKKKFLSQKKSLCHRIFQPQTKVSVREKSFRHRSKLIGT